MVTPSAGTHSVPEGVGGARDQPLGVGWLQGIFDASPDGIVAIGSTGLLLALNQKFKDLWQFPAGMVERRQVREMRQHSSAQIRDPDVYLQRLEALDRVAQPGLFDEIEFLDGRVFERYVYPYVPQGEKLGVIVYWRDISYRKAVEKQLRDFAERLDQALSGGDLSYWEADLETGIKTVFNRRWFETLGYSEDEFDPDLRQWDEIIHPDDIGLRNAARQAHLRGEASRFEVEFRVRHKQGHWVWIHSRGKVSARSPEGEPLRMVGTSTDVTQRKLAEQALGTLANTDGLTGVANRRYFSEVTTQELARATRYGMATSLLMLDLDHFKRINDCFGHAGGDEVLRDFVKVIQECLRGNDVVGRWGGEEFLVLLPQTGAEGAQVLARRVLELVRARQLGWNGRTIRYAVSIGVACSEREGLILEQLLKVADDAVYQAKAGGRDQVVYITRELPPPQ
jgi:diguanylate cyclase (GGDEF)-like protein/PAS domain S-box-containing protein